MSSSKRLTRDQVPAEQTWDLSALFTSLEEWEEALKTIEPQAEKLLRFKGTLHQGEQQLADCLHEYETLWVKVIQLSTYISLLQSGDGTDSRYQLAASVFGRTIASVQQQTAFIQSEITALPQEDIARFVHRGEGALANFQTLFEEALVAKPYQLSPETEEVLAALGQVLGSPYTVYTRLKASDMTFDDIVLPDGETIPNSFALFEDRYEFSADTAERRAAYKGFSETLERYKNGIAAAYETEVNKQVTLARLRGYESVTDMLLQSQQVTREMYNRQLDVIQEELAPHMRRLAKLRKRVLGLDEMTFADLKAPLDPEYNPAISFEQAGETIKESLAVMGEEYVALVDRALTERWVDRSDNIGKSTGAFCSSPYGVHPFISMTWADTMRGTFVLTHELGHAAHFHHANNTQSVTNTRPSRYFIEAPSTMNELLLGRHLLRTTDDARMKRWVIMQFLGTYYHNFVTHLLEGELQRRVYAKADANEPINATVLTNEKLAILRSFWGDAVTIDDAAGLTWMRQPHYYMELYPYTYSAGLTASTAVSLLIEEEGQPAVDRWIEVLKMGGTKSPLELLSHAGVDMTTDEPVRKAVAFVGELVAELEKSYEEANVN